MGEKTLEYAQANEMVRQYDRIAWTIAAIFIPISFGLIGVSYVIEKQSFLSLSILCISSVSLYSMWLVLDRRYTWYNRIIFRRMRKLEEELKFYLHKAIDEEDRKLRLRRIRRAGFWNYFMLGELIVIWILRIEYG